MVQPVKSLGHAAQDLSAGKFDALYLRAGDDEVGLLVDSFNVMSENLAASYNKLFLSEQKNRAITTTANDAIIMMDENGYVSFWNPAAETIFGYSAGEVLGRYLHGIIVPESYLADFERGFRYFNETGKGPAVGKTIELTARRKDGGEFPVELSLSALQMNDRWHAVGMVRDITLSKLAEKGILLSLEEKELLLQEIHHRVKNNLQVISSLLDLQLAYHDDTLLKSIFMEIKNRVKSMALVHEKLYRSKDLTRVDFHDYLAALIDNLYRSYSVNPAKIRLMLEVENVSLGIDTAIPCGLIVNELITNALKYAFPEGRGGKLHAMFRRSGEDAAGVGESN